MRIVSWNVNGIRACQNKGFNDFLRDVDPDIICLQEVKAFREQVSLPEGYQIYWHAADKAGYSGTAVFSKTKALSQSLDIPGHTGEGRILTLEYEDFFLINVYAPNSKSELERLDYRMVWQDALKDYIVSLDAQKPVIICGDLNVAHKEIDLTHPKTNRRSAGFTDEERSKLTELLDAGFTDTYRQLNPDKRGAYTWWSYIGNKREKNVGWRIDYFLISSRLLPNLSGADIYPQVLGSDHCPVDITLERLAKF